MFLSEKEVEYLKIDKFQEIKTQIESSPVLDFSMSVYCISRVVSMGMKSEESRFYSEATVRPPQLMS